MIPEENLKCPVVPLVFQYSKNSPLTQYLSRSKISQGPSLFGGGGLQINSHGTPVV